jgi:alkylation response protein AidB-like acyl-CoA dehydrogenase
VQFGNFGPIRTFAEYATPQQKARWLPDLLQGRIVMSLGITEPGAGSAATDLKTTAKLDGSNYVINGSKLFSTFSPDAAIFLVYVRYGPGVGGIGSVIVESDTPGFKIGNPSTFMSGEEWCELHFDNCRIPAENVLLGAGGFKKQMAGFNIERLGNTARSLAFGRYAFNKAREHAATREQFGRPLCEFQGLQWKFAEMAVKLEGAQLLLYRAATNADRGLPSAYETAVAKMACNQTGFDVANESVQIMGAMGYSQETLVEWCMRRCRGWMIAGGSIEVMKNRIAEHVFDRRFDQRPPKRAEACGVNLREALFAPRSVAIVGQSDDPTKTAGRPLKFLRQLGYAGRVYPINPRRDTVLGERALVVARRAARGARPRLHRDPNRSRRRRGRGVRRIGAKVATVLADGFAEAGAAGLAREAKLREICTTTGLRLVGPSSLGIVDLRTKSMMTANAAFDETDLPVGRIFAASHSGSLIGSLLTRGKARGIGFAGLVSVGNEVDLSLGDICEATLDDPRHRRLHAVS